MHVIEDNLNNELHSKEKTLCNTNKKDVPKKMAYNSDVCSKGGKKTQQQPTGRERGLAMRKDSHLCQ